jgi:UDP-glucose 4-epimerase
MSFWRERKVVVTGAAGLVGSHLCDLLIEQGSFVLGVDDFSKGTPERLKHLEGKIEILKGDLCNSKVADRAFQNQEVVMHLASRAYGIAYSQDHHEEMLQFNRKLNSTVIEAARTQKIERICVVSSSCVYPDDAPSPTPELPVMTGEPEKSNYGYGWAKRHLEIEAENLAKTSATKVAIVRPFNAYSGRYKWEGTYSHVIPSLIKRIMDGEDPLEVWGTGRQARNFLHAIDFARCFMAVTEHYAEADPVNVGYEDTITVSDLTKLICELAGKSPKIIFDPSKPEGRMVKSADSTKLRRVTGGIEPTIDFKTGMSEMMDWYHRVFGVKRGL